jgi:2-dehydro-3-deoxyphosphogluconate aldolase/(4S)-4-hydroxy-2-oxoglutarate aldolase|tara:strand:+ start:18193 stop:18786 length:594 start_codon:yes stop_codon:yes gene_type:complete
VLFALGEARLVPVLRLSSTEATARAVGWLAEAGLSVFEITLTVPGAVGLIEQLTKRGETLVGAGTVMNVADAERCLDAGARFLVSPCVVPELPALCHMRGAACLLGALTPSEVKAALDAGADAVKIFPASTVGLSHFKALRSVFPKIQMVPTGGIGAEDIADWLAAGAAFVGVGGKLTAGARDDMMAAARDLLARLP